MQDYIKQMLQELPPEDTMDGEAARTPAALATPVYYC
jgi:hypothetical protein